LAGFIVVFFSFLLTAALVVQRLFFANVQLGYTSTVCVIVFLSGVQLMVIGMASLYIGRVLREVQRRPLYLIRDTVNVDGDTATNV
jgi:hypothetical protein